MAEKVYQKPHLTVLIFKRIVKVENLHRTLGCIEHSDLFCNSGQEKKNCNHMNAHSRMEISFHCCQGGREKRVICYCNLQPIQYSQLQMLVPVGSIVDPDPIKYIYLDLVPTQILIYCGKKKKRTNRHGDSNLQPLGCNNDL